MKEGRRIKRKQALHLLQFGTWRILWLLFLLDSVLFSIWHTTLPVCQGPSGFHFFPDHPVAHMVNPKNRTLLS